MRLREMLEEVIKQNEANVELLLECSFNQDIRIKKEHAMEKQKLFREEWEEDTVHMRKRRREGRFKYIDKEEHFKKIKLRTEKNEKNKA